MDIDVEFPDPEKEEGDHVTSYDEEEYLASLSEDDEDEDESLLMHEDEESTDATKDIEEESDIDVFGETLIEAVMSPDPNEEVSDMGVDEAERTESAELDYMLQTIPIVNMSWKTFIDRVPSRIGMLDIRIGDRGIDEYVEIDNKIPVYEDCGDGDIRIVLLDGDHKLPYINDPNCEVRMITKLIDRNSHNPNGIVINQYLEADNIGLFTYMPITNHKKFKVCAFYEKIDGAAVYTTCRKYKPEDELVSPTKHGLKNVHDRETLDVPINSEHKIIISNINAKFARDIESDAFGTLKDVYFYLNDHVLNTIDGSYVMKLMKASRDLIRVAV